MRLTRSQEGSALVVVLVLIIGIVALLGFMLPVSQVAVKAQGDTTRRDELLLVLRAGIAEATREIKDGTDWDGDGGVGSLGTNLDNLGNTAAQRGLGQVVTTSDGRRLGRYRATVQMITIANQIYPTAEVTVVAAFPDFVNPTRAVAARIRVQALGPGDLPNRSAMQQSGPIDKGTDRVRTNSDDLTIEDPPPVEVPAVNAADPGFKADFIDEFVTNPEGGTPADISGYDPSTNGPGTGAQTIVTQPDVLVTNDSIEEVNDAIREFALPYVNGTTAPTAVITGNANGGKSITTARTLGTALTPGVFVFDPSKSDMKIESPGSVTGFGTLIITKELLIQNNGAINWTCDIIVVEGNNHAQLEVKDGTMNVTGNVIISPNPDDNKRADLRFSGGSNVVVNGNLLGLAPGGDANNKGESEFHIDNSGGTGGASVTVNGFLGLLGERIDFEVKGKSSTEETFLTVNGSFIVAFPEDGDKNELHKFRFEDNTHVYISYDPTFFQNGVALLNGFFDDPNKDPPIITWASAAYMELPGIGAENIQEAAIDGATAPLGVP